MKHYFKKEMYIAIRSLVSKYNIITIIIRCLVGSTDQACSSGFYFRIAWKSTERPCFLQNHSLSFVQGLRSLKKARCLTSRIRQFSKCWFGRLQQYFCWNFSIFNYPPYKDNLRVSRRNWKILSNFNALLKQSALS